MVLVPASSRGGGNTTAEVAASGKVLPVADAAGVTVDTTTYNDTIKGSGKLTTLVFPAEQGALAIAQAGDAFPRLVLSSDPTDFGLSLGNGTYDAPNSNQASTISCNGAGLLALSRQVVAFQATSSAQLVAMSQVSPRFTITSGALSTVQLVSGAGVLIDTTRDAETITPCTFNPGAATTATVTVALSPDNVTYSTLAVVTAPAGVALDGTILPINVRVPAGWYLKLTVNAQAVLGLTTYY